MYHNYVREKYTTCFVMEKKKTFKMAVFNVNVFSCIAMQRKQKMISDINGTEQIEFCI